MKSIFLGLTLLLLVGGAQAQATPQERLGSTKAEIAFVCELFVPRLFSGTTLDDYLKRDPIPTQPTCACAADRLLAQMATDLEAVEALKKSASGLKGSAFESYSQLLVIESISKCYAATVEKKRKALIAP